MLHNQRAVSIHSTQIIQCWMIKQMFILLDEFSKIMRVKEKPFRSIDGIETVLPDSTRELVPTKVEMNSGELNEVLDLSKSSLKSNGHTEVTEPDAVHQRLKHPER